MVRINKRPTDSTDYRLSRRRLLITVGALGLAAACTPAASGPASTASKGPDSIADGGTLIFATNLTADFPINPIIATNRPALWMFDPLVDLDAKTGLPAPALAESWTVSSDSRVYTFKLRRGVKWHDGKAFGADDVIFTFGAWLNDPSSIYRSQFTFGKDASGNARAASARKIDDYSVEITLPEASASFLENLTGWHGIAPKHLLEGQTLATTTFNQNPVGTGVLKFAELKTKQYVRFAMNKDYWRGRPHLDGFIWQVIPDYDAQVTALANKEIDVIKNVISDDMASRIEKIPNVIIYNALGNFTWALHLNHKVPAFQDLRVRQAIAMAVNKPELVKGTVGKNVMPADQMLPPSHWGFEPTVRVLKHDPEQAKALLREAGWTDSNGDGVVEKDGQPLAFTTITEIVNDATAVALQNYLKAVGIRVSIKQVERAVRTNLQTTGNWEAYTGYDGAAIPTSAFAANWRSGTWSGFSNSEVDRLIAEADKATDQSRRAAAVKQIEKTLTDQTAAIWLYYYNSAIAVRDSVGGLQLPPTTADQNNTGIFFHLEDLYLKPK
jgi:peptide/nickel transport system substrate-binding protein